MKKVYLVDYDRCNHNFCGRICIKKCPITLSNAQLKSHEKKKKVPIWFQNSTNKIRIKAENCLKCGVCVNVCPINAIYVKNILEEPEDLESTHKYPDNNQEMGFRLYNLPTLVAGQVSGLCGPNGIGKTTVLEIIAGRLKPNFGKSGIEKSNLSWNSIADNVRETEMRNHFKAIARDERKIAYKHQVLRIIFEKYGDETVHEILEKENEVNDKFFEKISKHLDLDVIQDRTLEQCSGGELQRFAIALVLIKEADIYIIDEPCTFLDVQKRIQLARLLRKRAQGFANQRPCPVLIVEHDLAVLDYASDLIQLFYGEPHKFGIISKPMTTKKGINSYLDGYLKAENIEFREKEYGFRHSTTGRRWSNALVFTEYGNITKTYDSFKLNVFPGKIYASQILGIMGENGVGKSTFAKILAGVIKPDAGSEFSQIQAVVSYKPQYITKDSELTSKEFIIQYSQNYNFSEDMYLVLYRPLGVDELIDKKISSLSGGELQRVYIAACLAKKADLYILDEPSAYLDVEERIKIGQIIRTITKKNNAVTICIEHDIQIADALIDQLLLFTGTPGVQGKTVGPLDKREGMNLFLKTIDVSFRRDPKTGRARLNKKGSHKDKMQRASGEYWGVKD